MRIILFSHKSLHREKDERRTRYCSVLALVQPPSAWPWSRFQVSHLSQISNHYKRLNRRPPLWFREIEYEQNCILYICKISEEMEYFDKEIKFHIQKKMVSINISILYIQRKVDLYNYFGVWDFNLQNNLICISICILSLFHGD